MALSQHTELITQLKGQIAATKLQEYASVQTADMRAKLDRVAKVSSYSSCDPGLAAKNPFNNN